MSNEHTDGTSQVEQLQSGGEMYTPEYGDLTRLNKSRLILDLVGTDMLRKIMSNFFMGTIGTSAAVYEKDGSYALGIFSSGWCRYLDSASWQLCGTDDNQAALDCGKWLCHESCWTDISKKAIQQGTPVDLPCHGGIRIYALPVVANDTIIGAINFAYGDPPGDPEILQAIAVKYKVPFEKLQEISSEYESRPEHVINQAKKRLQITATLIAEIVERTNYKNLVTKKNMDLELAQRIAAIGTWSLDPAVGVPEWSDEVYRIYERDPGLGPYPLADYKNLYKDEWWDIFSTAITNAIKEGIPYDIELKLEFPVGTVKWVHALCQPEQEKGPLGYRIRGTIQDITDRKQTDLALRALEKQSRSLLDHSPVCHKIVDLDDNLQYMSKNGFSMLQLEPNDALYGNKYPFDFFPEQFKKKMTANLAGVKQSGEVIKNEGLACDSKGNDVWLESSLIPVFEDGKIDYITVVSVDITERVRHEQERLLYEKQLQQTQRMEAIGTLAGGIAHDFNNMIGIIQGNVSYALGSLDENHELSEVLKDVLKSSKQVQALTQQLLTFSRGGAPITKTLDINKVIRDATVFSLRGSAAKCQFNLSDDLWGAVADENQIIQVINNLVINASQAMPQGGTIQITTENYMVKSTGSVPLAAGPCIKVTVEDHGVGISEQYLSKIFDPYFTTKQMGSGLGLATTYSIIQKHNGYITVSSEIEKGTIFTFYLPANPREKVLQKRSDTVHHSGNGTILIMDDQEALLKMLGRLLSRMGYQTVPATDGSIAVDLFREAHDKGTPFDLVILDLTVPGGIGGLETLETLLTIDPAVRAIATSGYSNNAIMSSYEDYGFCGIIPKPYEISHVAELLNTLSK
jgi:PAS domain S-box-containing protein